MFWVPQEHRCKTRGEKRKPGIKKKLFTVECSHWIKTKLKLPLPKDSIKMWEWCIPHICIWIYDKPIINWVLKKCNPVRSQTQILSLGLFTKSSISNQTKAIVPKAVIWFSVWSEFASLCELRTRISLIFIQRRKRSADARKEWQLE